MGLELPAVSAVIARLDDPEINLAAYGGVVFALALLVEAPIIMMLAASTALSKNRDAYWKLYRFMMVLAGTLTVVHLLIAFTPLYYVVVERLIGAPEPVVEAARPGLMIMLPWTWFIAYRRFNQGALIRFGHSNAVGIGTIIRLSVTMTTLTIGLVSERFPGIVIGPAAVIAGVVSEAIYAGLRIRPVLRNEIPEMPAGSEPLTYRAIADFYIPLALTSLIFLIAQPILSASMSRMPLAIPSLAVWGVLSGLVFLFRSAGIAFLEVVVALLDEPGSSGPILRFSWVLAGAITLGMALIAFTPLSGLWFGAISGLSPDLVEFGKIGLILALLWPLTNVFQSLFQGAILYSRKTRAVTEAVVIFLTTATAVNIAGVRIGEVPGIYIGVCAVVLGSIVQTLWLFHRARPTLRQVIERDRLVLNPRAEGEKRDLSRAIDP
ncbi:MAG TPA: hypothetical protein VJ768_08195 [Anaerolineales bacterium]|nr:hypothetical protein [Anaerolineales bacterium]